MASTLSTKNGMIAVGQLCSTPDFEKNFENVASLVKQVVTDYKGAVKLLCLPECFAYISGGDQGNIANTDTNIPTTGVQHQDLTGPLFTRYRNLAKDNDLWISYGGFHEKAPDQPKIFNTHVIVDNNGEIKSVYRKLHLFKVDIKGGPNLDETKGVIPGKDLVVVDSPVGKLGLSICYDVRFPEQYIALRKMGAEIILVPSAFTLMTGKDHWEVLMKARAIETQCYVVAAAQIGAHHAKRSSYGRAMIVDPWGTVVACCSDTSPTAATAIVDHKRIESVRASMPVFEHRRSDIYGDVIVVNEDK